MAQHETYYATNLMTYALNDVQISSLMSSLFAHNASVPSPNWSYILELPGGNESAVMEVDPSETAFFHRDKPLLHQFSVGDPGTRNIDDGIALVNEFRQRIVDLMGNAEWGMYANYVDTELDPNEAQHLYWGDNLPRLQRLKAKLDPEQVFWNPHGIRP